MKRAWTKLRRFVLRWRLRRLRRKDLFEVRSTPRQWRHGMWLTYQIKKLLGEYEARS